MAGVTLSVNFMITCAVWPNPTWGGLKKGQKKAAERDYSKGFTKSIREGYSSNL